MLRRYTVLVTRKTGSISHLTMGCCIMAHDEREARYKAEFLVNPDCTLVIHPTHPLDYRE